MNLTRLFVQRPTLAFVLLALIALAGGMAAPQIVQQQFPNVEQPTISVYVSYSGASPTVMRDSIVLPIEDQIAGAPDLQTLNSTIQGGQASISATFTLNSNVNTDLVNVQKAVQSASRNLPSDLTAPTVRNADPSERVVVTLSVLSKTLDAAQLSLLVNGRLVPAMEQIPGVSNVNASGLVTPAYEVQVNPSALSAYGYTLTDVVNTIGSNNIRAPGGIAYESNRETNIDVRGDIVDAASIAGLVLQGAPTQVPDPIATIGPSNPWTVAPALRRIGDVAQITAGNEPRRQYAAVNGQPGLFLSIQKQSAVSEVTASNNVLAALPQLRRQYPQLTFGIVEVQSHVTQQQLGGVLRTLAEAVFLTAIVMLFFLHSWRNAIVVMIAIPTSLCVTLFAMWLMGLTLDTVSLLGMTLVIGVLVDDSTVVLENIERHHEELHEEPKTAAIRGRSEIGLAAIVITLVDVVVFLPIAFLQGNQVGRQLAEFGIVVTISTLVSLFISFTITPTLAGLWALKSTWQAPWIIQAFTEGFDRVRAWYTKRVLAAGLRHPKVVVGISLVSFVGAFLLLPLGLVGQEFIPGQDQGEIFVQFNYPTGTPLSVTHAGVTKVEQQIDKIRDISAETSVAGAYAASFGGFVAEGNVGQIHLFLKDDRNRSTTYWTRQIQRTAQQLVPTAHPVVVNSSTTSGGNKQPIDYLITDVSGSDPTQDALRVMQILQATPGAASVNSSATALMPQVAVIFNRDKARALDVSIGAASTAIRAAFGGAIATQFETPDGLEQVQVIYPIADQTDLAAISAIPIRTINGNVVHVGDIATFQNDPAPGHHASQPRHGRSRQCERRPGLEPLRRAVGIPKTARSRPPARKYRRSSGTARPTGSHGTSAAGPRDDFDPLGRPGVLADGGALQQLRLAVHHPLCRPGRDGRRFRRPVADASDAQPLLAHRLHPARRARYEERHPAGRLREYLAGRAPLYETGRHHRERAYAIPPDHHDDGLDDRGDDAARALARARLRSAQEPRDRGHRRPDELPALDARPRPGHVHVARAHTGPLTPHRRRRRLTRRGRLA